MSDRNSLNASFNFLHDKSPNGIQIGHHFHQRRGADRQRRRLRYGAQRPPGVDLGADFELRERIAFRRGHRPPGRHFRPVGIGTGPGLSAGFRERHLHRPRQLSAARRTERTAPPVSRTTPPGPRANTPSGSVSISPTPKIMSITSPRHLAATPTRRSTPLRWIFRAIPPAAKYWQKYSQTFGNPVADFSIKDYRILSAGSMARHRPAERDVLERATNMRNCRSRAFATTITRTPAIVPSSPDQPGASASA